MTTKLLAIAVTAVSLTFFSCSTNSGTQNNQSADEADSTITPADSSATMMADDNELSYNLPSPLQIAFVFKKSGAGFISTIPNNKANITKYNTSNYKKAINFGIYSSDLAYCLFNKKYQESKEYLKACKDIGSYLGLDKAFESDNMAQRFDKNISNDDSLIKIISTVQMKTDIMFEENKQKHIKVLAIAGAWTESLYIACEIYTKDKNKKIQASLLEQLLLAETIIKALKSNEGAEQEVPALITSIEKINTEFNMIPAVSSAIERDEEIDSNTISISDNEIRPMIESIKALRSEMIK